jgi:hypothetical protein
MGDMRILVTVMWRVVSRLLRYLGRGALLVPVAAIGMALFAVRPWTVAAIALALAVAVWRPVVAAVLLPVTMVVAGISGLVVAATTPAPSSWAVFALVALKQRLVSGPAAAKVAQIRIVRAGVVFGRRFVHARLVPVPRFRAAVKIPAGARLNWTPPNIAAQAMAGPKWSQTIRGGGPPVQFHRVGVGGGFWPGYLVPLALLLLTLGLWLLPRTVAVLRTHTAGLISYLRLRMLENRWGILLIPSHCSA